MVRQFLCLCARDGDCHRDLRANRRDDGDFVGYTDQTGVCLSRAYSRTLRHLSDVSPEEDFNRTFCLSYCIQISLLGLNILCTGHGSRGVYCQSFLNISEMVVTLRFVF